MALASSLGTTLEDLSSRGVSPAHAVPTRYTLGVVFGVADTAGGLGFARSTLLAGHPGGQSAGDEAFGLMGALSGLSCAFIGVILRRWLRARRSAASAA